jgi:cytochrome c oxidase cbb3-type subunit IV
MEIYSVLGSISTVVSFLAFLGIVAWAYGKGRKQAFERAALEPFALPDETEQQAASRRERPHDAQRKGCER